MPPTPTARKTVARRPVELRVRFHAPLRGARLVPADALVVPPQHTAPPAREPELPPKPALPPVPSPNAAPPAPLDYLPGEAAARERAADRERIDAVLAEVRTAVAGLRTDRAGRLEQMRQMGVELGATIASRILHERIATDDFPIDDKVRDMMAQLGQDVAVVVRLNPLDLEMLKDRLDRAGDDALMTGPDAPRFVPDSALNRGECQVEGRESMLLSDVSRELQEIRDDLLRRLDDARP